MSMAPQPAAARAEENCDMEMLSTSYFWVTLGQIMMINILLSGDNAVVIALASRSLPPAQQKKAILFGSFGAIVLRVILTFFAVALLALPFLKIVGGLMLVWIGIKMLVPDEEDGELEGHSNLSAAIRTIIVADFVMSLDNVLGVAAAAKGNVVLLVIGLAISIPLIVYGSTLVLRLMERFPAIVIAGAGLLGWVAGEMMVSDPALGSWVLVGDHTMHGLHAATPAICAALVVALGTAVTHTLKVSDLLAAKPLEDLAAEPALALATARKAPMRGAPAL
jgi:YjbE family integral membrane protein